MKFPQKPEECGTFKVDVLDLLGSARLAFNPDENEYLLALEPAIEGGEPPDMEVAFRVRRPGDPAPTRQAAAEPPGKAVPPPPDEKALDQKKESAAREYLEKHGLTSFMQFLMQSLMKDKPSDPYSFLQKQVTKRMVTEVSRAALGEKAELPSDGKYSADVTKDQLRHLEAEAAAAGAQLREDNQKLRETADMLKGKYGKLVEDVKTEANTASEVPLLAALPPKGPDETPQMAAYREIAAMQDDVTSLARENASLVSQLTNMRLSIESVRDEIELMNQDTPHGKPAEN